METGVATTSCSSVMEAGPQPNRNAEEPSFAQELDRKYICPICLAVIKDAMQTVCGHRFCARCIRKVCKDKPLVKCPVDNTLFRCSNEIYSDVAFQREIMSLEVKCSNLECVWSGEYRNLEPHVENCPCGLVTCEFGCSAMVMRRQLTDHMEVCGHRPVQCEHCNKDIIFINVTRHQLLDCAKFPVKCSLCSQTGILRQDIQSHLDKTTGQCPNVTVPCTYSQYGCGFQSKRFLMRSHEEEFVHSHLKLLEQRVVSQSTKINKLTNEIGDLTSMLEEQKLQSQLTGHQLLETSNMSYDGHLLWKVKIQGNQPIYSSRSFYTGRPGYKLRISIDLDGVGEAPTKYVSLFLHLEKGQYDDELMFPFHASFQAKVLARESSNHNHTMTIHCEKMQVCRNEGDSAMRGRLRFMLKEKFLSEQYCKDNTVFIDVRMKQ